MNLSFDNISLHTINRNNSFDNISLHTINTNNSASSIYQQQFSNPFVNSLIQILAN